jgi:hypothetical protein
MEKQIIYEILKLNASQKNFNLKLTPKQINKKLIREIENPYFNKLYNLIDENEKDSEQEYPYLKEMILVDCDYKKQNDYYYSGYKTLVIMIALGYIKLTDAIKCLFNVDLNKIKIIKGFEGKKYTIKVNKNNSYIDKLNKQMDTESNLAKLILDGFTFRKKKYVLLGMSGSMARGGIKAFIQKKYYDEVFEFSANGEVPEKCQIPKYEAYRNLLFSSAHSLDYIPNIVVVKDYEILIPDVLVKYPIDSFVETVDSETGEIKKFPCKKMELGKNTEKINCIDGCGMGEQSFFEVINEYYNFLGYKTNAVQFRLSQMKGLIVHVPFLSIFKELGVKQIIDTDGIIHKFDEEKIDAIIPESVYKGSKFFKSFAEFKANVIKYGHKFAITGWNKPSYLEKNFTRLNMQYLQVLSGLDKNKIIELVNKYSIPRIESILTNEDEAIKFLGIESVVEEDESDDNYNEDGSIKIKVDNDYVEAIKYNKKMLHDSVVNDYVKGLVEKYIKQMKYGKIWCSGRYRYLVPDMYLFITHIAKISGYDIEPTTCLNENEIFVPVHSKEDSEGNIEIKYLQGEYAGFRSPMLAENEVNAFNAVSNEICKKYFSHMDNLIMICSNSINLKRMQTADTDGDRCYLSNEGLITTNFQRNLPLIVDINEAKAPIKLYNQSNLLDYHLKTLDCLIGQCTNKCSTLLNKENREKYIEYVELLSIIVQKETDYVKNGIRWETGYYIDLLTKKLPDFFRFRYDWLADKAKVVEKDKKVFKKKLSEKLSKTDKEIIKIFNTPAELEKYCNMLSNKWRTWKPSDLDSPVAKTKSPLNKLCEYVEKWETNLNFKDLTRKEDMSYLYLDKSNYYSALTNTINRKRYARLEQLFLNFNKECSTQMRQLKKKNKTTDESKEAKDFKWNSVYAEYKKYALVICKNEQELLHYAYDICYNLYPDKSKKFMWIVSGDTILENLKYEYDRKQKIGELASILEQVLNNKTNGNVTE